MSNVAQTEMLLTCVEKVHRSNLWPEHRVSRQIFQGYHQFTQVVAGIICQSRPWHFHILSSLLFTIIQPLDICLHLHIESLNKPWINTWVIVCNIQTLLIGLLPPCEMPLKKKRILSFLCNHTLFVTVSHKCAVLLRMFLKIADVHFL